MQIQDGPRRTAVVTSRETTEHEYLGKISTLHRIFFSPTFALCEVPDEMDRKHMLLYQI